MDEKNQKTRKILEGDKGKEGRSMGKKRGTDLEGRGKG